jgi:hypothetical protein
VIIGVIGWWLTHSRLFIDIGILIIGTQFIFFGRDLAGESVDRYKIQPTFARAGYFLVGVVFVFCGLLWLFSDFALFS